MVSFCNVSVIKTQNTPPPPQSQIHSYGLGNFDETFEPLFHYHVEYQTKANY